MGTGTGKVEDGAGGADSGSGLWLGAGASGGSNGVSVGNGPASGIGSASTGSGGADGKGNGAGTPAPGATAGGATPALTAARGERQLLICRDATPRHAEGHEAANEEHRQGCGVALTSGEGGERQARLLEPTLLLGHAPAVLTSSMPR